MGQSGQQVKLGGALSLDGINDYVSIAADASLDFTHSYSVSTWLKPVFYSGDAMVWFGYHYGSPNQNRSIHLRGYVNGAIRFGNYGDDITTSAGVLQPDAWNHVVVTYDYNSDTSAIYVDGNLVISGNSGPYQGGFTTATIGKWNVSFQSQEHFKGLFDDMRIYNRALSAEEVKELSHGELLGLEIVGPNEVAENFQTQYKAIAHYDNNSTADVTDSVDWSVEPNDIADIDAGLLETEDIDKEEIVTVYAEYEEDGNTVSASKEVRIFPICPVGSALEFDGVDDYVDLGTVNSLKPNHDNVTYAVWFKTAYSGTTQMIMIFSAGTGWGQDGYYRLYVDADGNITASVRRRLGSGDTAATVIGQNEVGYGDCEDSAVLLAVMYKGAGYRSAIVVGPGHTTALVYLPDYDKAKIVFELDGDAGWVWAEATSKNNTLGWVPRECINAQLTAYEVSAESLFSAKPPTTPPTAIPSGTTSFQPFSFISIIGLLWFLSLLRRRRAH